MNIHIVTLGCSKNTVDSEVLAGTLVANNMMLVDNVEDADTLVINTCGFIDLAKEESVNTIIEAAERKKAGEIATLVVAGCLSERYADDLRKEFPEVDHFFGTEAFEGIVKALSPDLKYSLLGERMSLTSQPYAYLKISEGCDRPCSFCAIPIMRGKHRSVAPDALVAQAQLLVKQGAKELVLIAQDLTYYGLDSTGNRTLGDLLRRLADESGADWIRCMYAFPSGFPTDILDAMASRSNICNYLDMPLQHTSNSVLKSMRRGITREKTEELLDTIRQMIPDITLRSTFILGYPNETESDVDELADFLVKQRLDRVGVFAYSQEDDTYAHILGDPIPQETKEARIARILEVQREISNEKNEAKVGTKQRVLIEENVGGEWLGRTAADAPEVDNEVYVRSAEELTVGQFVDVVIEDHDDFSLFATV